MNKVFFVLFSSQFQSNISDAGQNFPFHVVPDEELQRVSLVQFQHGEGELVLKETHSLTVDVTVFFHQLALQGVGFLLVAGNGALLNQQVQAGEWELHRGAQADVGMIAA